jgi:glycine/D-amino acid oxidase-like deaminating enzyme
MLYAVAQRNSKVSAGRFWRMYKDMGSPIALASPTQAALFDPTMIEAVFDCTEYAFDYSVLRTLLLSRIDALGLDLRLNTEVLGLEESSDGVAVTMSDGRALRAGTVFNVTYGHVNRILQKAGLPEARLKHELTEIALVTPPEEMAGQAVTVMDGPFFSAMPYPSERLYSLTHVRYTPHLSWIDAPDLPSPYRIAAAYRGGSRAQHMLMDASRYIPSLSRAEIRKSIFDVKTVLLKNEQDDGRPILFQRRPADSRVISILGGKIDNIYDLFDLVRQTEPAWAGADLRHLLPQAVPI